MKNVEKYLEYAPEVKKAIAEGRPIVALESTIISHGMPYPQNVETAKKVEDMIREGGAVPATIAIVKGKIKVGLTEEELMFLGQSKDVVKASRRDLPLIIAKELNGATTVASTMIIAALAGIKVFVTGGIGGVHRGAQETLDISADLMELAQTNVAVVCAGVKSILDIGLTLEVLETHGVPIVGYQTEDFPAFYTRKSGYGVDYAVANVEELARALKAKWDLDLKGGVVVANPIPEAYAMDEALITQAIDEAVQEAAAKGIQGKETTPFLLTKIKEITEGKSLESNIELVFNNAKIGAELAVALHRLS
ncbi:Indigoidine synthase A family protein [Alkaliphilus metalliredigens QYMF]|uniref:Pseudouridine-5'-phosphate glycosidase n=1 Tax=Alkaliphilus metalliredigens (strain QYMF) TaxID=293826 RepID=PSUG_ALKMQ|nr:pseudouridine-5'-phosphate glycosidase [Alkaliphilus metalliredigens]A6TL60.1 RecName: Full=Pseudouridine-5'-phosphate glycosidase; Short=PsiMP glycosidase [Alkaliphilus metalliredigens QYMF]ABR46928.1 Indigoidine synthase A family protein [Alkaliphilus metalliredigens QYMF]